MKNKLWLILLTFCSLGLGDQQYVLPPGSSMCSTSIGLHDILELSEPNKFNHFCDEEDSPLGPGEIDELCERAQHSIHHLIGSRRRARKRTVPILHGPATRPKPAQTIPLRTAARVASSVP